MSTKSPFNWRQVTKRRCEWETEGIESVTDSVGGESVGGGVTRRNRWTRKEALDEGVQRQSVPLPGGKSTSVCVSSYCHWTVENWVFLIETIASCIHFTVSFGSCIPLRLTRQRFSHLQRTAGLGAPLTWYFACASPILENEGLDKKNPLCPQSLTESVPYRVGLRRSEEWVSRMSRQSVHIQLFVCVGMQKSR